MSTFFTERKGNQEITWSQLTEEEGKREKKKITDFCGFFIYRGECTKDDCPRIHSTDITKMNHYLGCDNLKTGECRNGPNCTFFVCRFRHDPIDYLVYQRSSGEGDDELRPIQEATDEERTTAMKEYNEKKNAVRPQKQTSQEQIQQVVLAAQQRAQLAMMTQQMFPSLVTPQEQAKRQAIMQGQQRIVQARTQANAELAQLRQQVTELSQTLLETQRMLMEARK
jgi:hypothetical protein